MKLNRIFACLIGCAAFLLSILAYTAYLHLLGFPDGFITELESAEKKLAYIFIGVSLISGSYFIYLGTKAARQQIGKKLVAAISLYFLFIIGLLLVDYHYRIHLMGGGGG